MKELINEIIKDLGEDKPIGSLLLKVQVIAARLKNEEFSRWIRSEQNGYTDRTNLPEYRILPCVVKADVSVPFQGIYPDKIVPVDAIELEIARDCMSHYRCGQSLSEIETICANADSGMLHSPLPAIAYREAAQFFPTGNVEALKQQFAVSSLQNVVYQFKSKLLDFFLQLDERTDGGFDFSNIGKTNQIVSQIMSNTTYNINAMVANVGDGSISTGDIRDNTSTQSITNGLPPEFIDIFEKLKAEVSSWDNEEASSSIEIIEEEMAKPEPKKSKIRLCLNALKGIAETVTAAGAVVEMINMGLGILG